MFGVEYKLRGSLLCSSLQSPVASTLFGPNILNTLFSNTLSLRSSLNVSDQVSHPYKSTGKIIVLYILIFMFLYCRQEDRKVLDCILWNWINNYNRCWLWIPNCLLLWLLKCRRSAEQYYTTAQGSWILHLPQRFYSYGLTNITVSSLRIRRSLI
jgi:hypothetical protein